MKGKKNSKVFILVFLGMLTAFGPFVTDMYLPTLPAMSEYFHTTSSMVQLGLTASMIGLAAGQLLFGPLSDKYGRRLPLIISMILFAVATIGCIYSYTIMQFVGWRLIQGIAEQEVLLFHVQLQLTNTLDVSWQRCLLDWCH